MSCQYTIGNISRLQAYDVTKEIINEINMLITSIKGTK